MTKPVITLDFTDEMNDDWLRAARLKKAAQNGDEAAQKELDRMEDEKLEE